MGLASSQSIFTGKDGVRVPMWNGSKAVCPLLEAYAAYACPDDLKTWTCGWCRKMNQEPAAVECSPLEHVAVVMNQTTNTMAYVGYRAETNTVVIAFRGVMPDSELNRIQATGSSRRCIQLVPFAGGAPDAKGTRDSCRCETLDQKLDFVL
jgi:hypothetical protein